ncbi:MAG TPA: outer membrane beta-barrel family protein [Phenylobacterium sp.]|nr:outer membrane beta-barrel family protein [Phenylobacterium sp.]
MLLAAALAAASHARAQSQTPASQPDKAAPDAPAKAAPAKSAPKGPAAKTVEGVTVTGASQNGFRSSIDRRSYGVANDLASTTGSISDALKNIPSVEVDVQGNVSLRGDTNVAILIDGKPSTLFKGPGAAQALQALPADQIERVEVITNPSAQFSPEGSAGIINLITKQNRKPGRSGSLRANLGTAGRRNIGVGGAYNSNKLTLSGDLAWRHDPQHSVSTDDRATTDPVTGQPFTSHSEGSSRGPLEILTARAGTDYDIDAATRVSGEVRYNNFTFGGERLFDFAGSGPTGALVQSVHQAGGFENDRVNTSGQLSLRHKFSGDDHTLSVSLNHERVDENNDLNFIQAEALPAVPDFSQDVVSENHLNQTQLKADYSRPMPSEGRLKAGYDLRIDDNDYDTLGTLGPSAATRANDPRETNLFLYKQTVDAAYVTYEQPFGGWTVLGGLRLEDVRLDLNQVTTHITGRQDYFRAYPSLHLAYKVSDTNQLVLSYSERVQRPNPTDLNPFRSAGNFYAQQGNPNLRPQDTQSFEAGWQIKDNGTFYLATLYYRQNSNGVTDVITNLGSGVLLTTKANLAQSRNAGLELVANGHLTKTLSYNASTNVYWNEIDASQVPLGPGLGFGSTRSAFTAGGRASLNWQVTPNDLFQVSGQLNAKRLLPQGYSDPMFLMFLGYRHKFSDSFSAVVTVQDPLNRYRFKQVIDTPTLREVSEGRGRIQAAFVGLTWAFGAATKRPQGFDFGGGSAP